LTLDDSNGKSIYQWAMSNTDLTGEVYAAKVSNPTWSTINCSTQANITAEDTIIGFTATSIDSINETFNETTHNPIMIAGRNMTSCRSTSTYVSDAKQAQASAYFQEVLLTSGSSNIIYASPINQGKASYNDGLVDFQMMLADDVTTAITTYYFFVELG